MFLTYYFNPIEAIFTRSGPVELLPRGVLRAEYEILQESAMEMSSLVFSLCSVQNQSRIKQTGKYHGTSRLI